MEIDDTTYIHKNLTTKGLVSQVDFQRRKQPSRCASVCLGLLCALLLAGNIGQIIYYEIISRPTTEVQASYSTEDRLHADAVTAERNQLEARLTNLTKDREQLQQSYDSLTAERDDLEASFNNLKNHSDQLLTNYNDTQRNLQASQTDRNNLKASKEQLQTDYNNLQRGNQELQTFVNQLQGNYSALQRDKDQLQVTYNTLSTSKNRLQISYNSLQREKDQLQTTYNALQREKQQLQTSLTSLRSDRDQLQRKVDKVRDKSCQFGWKKFHTGCYFLSTVTKSWRLSKLDCIAKGADLVVIDSRDEQAFLNGLLKSSWPLGAAWIGLTDSVREGTWVWVDGTPLTTTYWAPRQPNNHVFSGHDQDCVKFEWKNQGVGEWNDKGCSMSLKYFCEK